MDLKFLIQVAQETFPLVILRWSIDVEVAHSLGWGNSALKQEYVGLESGLRWLVYRVYKALWAYS